MAAQFSPFMAQIGPDDLDAIRAADAVILPQGCYQSLYEMARKNCKHVFPNFDLVEELSDLAKGITKEEIIGIMNFSPYLELFNVIYRTNLVHLKPTTESGKLK